MAKYKKKLDDVKMKCCNVRDVTITDKEKLKIMCHFTQNMGFRSWRMEQLFRFAIMGICSSEVRR